MHRLRLLFLLVVVVAMGTTSLGQSQDGTGGLDDQIQNKFGDKDQNQAKADKKQDKAKTRNNDGHRKHWWSPPHFRHKKHDNNSAVRQPETKSNSRTAVAKPMNNAPAPKPTVTRHAAVSNSGNSSAMAAKPTHKTMAARGHANTTAAANKPGTRARGKTVASANHTGKPARHNCASSEAKKGGCQAVQKHTAKAATRAS